MAMAYAKIWVAACTQTSPVKEKSRITMAPTGKNRTKARLMMDAWAIRAALNIFRSMPWSDDPEFATGCVGAWSAVMNGFREFPPLAVTRLKVNEFMLSCWLKVVEVESALIGDPFLKAQIHVVLLEVRSIEPVAHLSQLEPAIQTSVSTRTEKIDVIVDQGGRDLHRTLAVILPFAMPEPSSKETWVVSPVVFGSTSPFPRRGESVTLVPVASA